MFVCRFCNIKFFVLNKYNAHLFLHRRISFPGFRCEFENCRRLFKSYLKFKNHIHRSHMKALSKNISDKIFKCAVTNCDFTTNIFNELKCHVYKHFKEYSEISCPLSSECKSITSFKSVNWLSNHFMRNHYNCEPKISSLITNLISLFKKLR